MQCAVRAFLARRRYARLKARRDRIRKEEAERRAKSVPSSPLCALFFCLLTLSPSFPLY